MMIVGDGRSGKTALVNSILNSVFQPTDSTIGINEASCTIFCNNSDSEVGGEWCRSLSSNPMFETAIARHTAMMNHDDRSIACSEIHIADINPELLTVCQDDNASPSEYSRF